PAIGGALANAKTWTFATPAPTVKQTYPEGKSISRDALMFVEFDQRIDPAAVLKTIRVLAGNTQLSLRLATNKEIEGDESVKELTKNGGKDRWLAFRAVDRKGDFKFALPGDAGITVEIGPGTPSAEGPRTTAEKHEFHFFTFGPLRMTKFECGYNHGCTPNDQWRLEFSNQIDAARFEESQLRVEPALEGLKTIVSGNLLTINGFKKPNTTFKLTIDKSLQDTFGQTLGKDETVEFKVGAMQPWITLSGQGLVVLDPAGPRQLSLYSVNYQVVKLTLYAVEPEDWIKFQS